MEYQQHVTLGESGRLVIPASYRKELNIEPGDDLIMKIQDGELRIFSQAEALARIRKAVKATRPTNKSATDDFLDFRKKDDK